MLRPIAGYRALAAASEAPSIAIGAGQMMLVLGFLVSVSATGRFAPVEAVFAMVSFSWIPIAHAIAMALTVRVFARATPWRRAFALYLEGTGAWQALFLVLIGGILFGPHTDDRSHVLFYFPLLVIALGWSIGMTWALFHAGMGTSRARAGLATLFFWVVQLLVVLTYYLAAGQLWPIL